VTTTGLIPKSGVWSYYRSAKNAMPFGFGHLFAAEGYRTLAYHNHSYTYYGRDESYPNMGYEFYGLGSGLDVKATWPESDIEMMEKSVPQYINDEHFMVYYLTVSGHLNYNLEENAMCRRHWDAVKDLPYSEAVRCYLASQMELELAVSSLIQQLEEAGKLDDTVIVLSGDHYPYGLTDEQYSELLGHEVDPVFEIYKSSLILWNSQMETPQVVEKYCSSLDIMPTLSNLFGLSFDSRLVAGKDIFSEASDLVIFSNYSFITDVGYYDSTTDTFVNWDGSKPDQSYVAKKMAQVQNRVAYSAAILDHDYYRVVLNGS
jgi:phosphoglycerol transferase MdoB-like AlkP superfamily enzyme